MILGDGKITFESPSNTKMTANRSCSLEAHFHIMKRVVLTVLLLLAAPLCMTLDYSGSNIEPLVINDGEPSFSYGSNSQNLSYTTTFIQSDWNASVTALGYDNDGNFISTDSSLRTSAEKVQSHVFSQTLSGHHPLLLSHLLCGQRISVCARVCLVGRAGVSFV